MALPTSADLSGLDFVAGGLPFVVTATTALTPALTTMDIASGGLPFVATTAESAADAALVSQLAVEVLRDNTDPGGGNLRVSGVAVEYLLGISENVYVTTLVVERLSRFTGVSASVGKGKSWMVFDEGHTLDVFISYGPIPTSAADKYAVLNGENLALWGREIIGFRDVTSLGGSRYRLSCLLRGRYGTEWAMNSHGTADPFMLLTLATIKRVTHDATDLGVNRFYRGVTIGQLIDSAIPRGFANQGVGLKPYAPCHVTGSRDGSDNLTITWFRRARYNAEWRDALEIPIGEESEAYEVDVLDGAGTVVRTITDLTTPTASYTAAEQTTDFGAPQAAIVVVVYQLSGIVGRGYGTTISV